MKAKDLIKILSQYPNVQVYFKDQYGDPLDKFEEYDISYYPAHKAYLVARKGVGEDLLD